MNLFSQQVLLLLLLLLLLTAPENICFVQAFVPQVAVYVELTGNDKLLDKPPHNEV